MCKGLAEHEIRGMTCGAHHVCRAGYVRARESSPEHFLRPGSRVTAEEHEAWWEEQLLGPQSLWLQNGSSLGTGLSDLRVPSSSDTGEPTALFPTVRLASLQFSLPVIQLFLRKMRLKLAPAPTGLWGGGRGLHSRIRLSPGVERAQDKGDAGGTCEDWVKERWEQGLRRGWELSLVVGTCWAWEEGTRSSLAGGCKRQAAEGMCSLLTTPQRPGPEW